MPDPDTTRPPLFLDATVQLLVWGYAVTGHPDVTAMVAENHPSAPSTVRWDNTLKQMAGRQVAHGDAAPRPVRLWAALPWVVEHAVRGHIPWPGL